MTIKQKRAIYYSIRDKKIEELKKLIEDNKLMSTYYDWAKEKKYHHRISELKAFCREFNLGA